jgi:hypothetical protein
MANLTLSLDPLIVHCDENQTQVHISGNLQA